MMMMMRRAVVERVRMRRVRRRLRLTKRMKTKMRTLKCKQTSEQLMCGAGLFHCRC